MRILSSETVRNPVNTYPERVDAKVCQSQGGLPNQGFVPIDSGKDVPRFREIISGKGETVFRSVPREGSERKFLEMPTASQAKISGKADVPGGSDVLSIKKKKLREAAEGFEAMLARQILKNMRASLTEGGLFGKGTMGEIYSDIMDTSVAEAMAKRSEFGLADAIYNQLVKTLELDEKSSGAEIKSGKTP